MCDCNSGGVADMDKENSKTTLTLSMSVEEKQKLKMIAIQKNMTVSALVQQWISEHEHSNSEMSGE